MNKINKTNFNSIDQIRNQYLKQKTQVAKNAKNDTLQPSFSHILGDVAKSVEQSELKFSKHASQRLNSRNIDLTQGQMERLEQGARIADKKGVKDSLVIVDDIAFIVNIKNHTVVTAVNDEEEKTFTNIDGAVIM